MTIEEIRANAPEGATHIVPTFGGDDAFIKIADYVVRLRLNAKQVKKTALCEQIKR